MKKEDFFEVLGELDDDIVKGAKTTMKKKMGRNGALPMPCCGGRCSFGIQRYSIGYYWRRWNGPWK